MTQEPPPPALRRLTEAHATAARIGRAMGDSIWPGFRPDTIPVLYVLPDTGTLLLGWRGDLPAGFAVILTSRRADVGLRGRILTLRPRP